jgi:hypothetical protein
MRYPQFAGRNLHYLSRGPRWLGERADCNVSTFFFTLGVIDVRILSSTMLFHLINRNPNKDITLHVSTNNPAMVWLLSIRNNQGP